MSTTPNAAQEVKCPNPTCNELNPAGNGFCDYCGQKMSGVAQVASALPSSPALPTAPAQSASVDGYVAPTVMSIVAPSMGLKQDEPIKAESTIGRAGTGATLEINHPTVTSTPFAVVEENGEVFVEDRGSSNGTYVMLIVRKDVPGRNRIRVNKGDMILAGEGVRVIFG